jgi:hypothetical protein
MTAVVFRTETLLSPDAFQVFGVSAKPNSNNPIGYFGTGLKYAIAVLLREHIDVSIYIGLDHYVFYTKRGEFRGTDYQQIRMKKRGFMGSWTYHQLPFTTQLGKNWKLWQALRELQSNTLDERGGSLVSGEQVMPESGMTKIVVRGDAFMAEYLKIGEIFLPDAHRSDTPWDGKQQCEIFNRPSEFVYFRSLRVKDLPRESHANLTYNILEPLQLTEDRTVLYDFYMHRIICNAIAVCDDQAICELVAKSDDDTLEGRLDWDWCSVALGPVWLEAVRRYGKKHQRAYQFSTRYDAPVVQARTWKHVLCDAIDGCDRDLIVDTVLENAETVKALIRGY